MKVLTYNLYLWPVFDPIHTHIDMNKETRSDNIIKYILKEDFDVLCLQENLYEIFINDKRLKNYKYRSNHPSKNYGLSIYSKHEIVHENFQIFKHQTDFDLFFSNKGYMISVVKKDNKFYSIINVHTGSYVSCLFTKWDVIISKQINEVILQYKNIIRDIEYQLNIQTATIICGDFNSNLYITNPSFVDNFKIKNKHENTLNLMFKFIKNMECIDYMLTNIDNCEVEVKCDILYSDHFPIELQII